MRQTLVAVLVAAALSLASSEASAQCSGCGMPSVGASNINAYYAGLYDYYCYYYRDGNCTTAQQYAAAAGVPVFAPTGGQCNNAAIYNWYCRYYEYNGYGWDYYGYCSTAINDANANACCACSGFKEPPEVQRLFFMKDNYTGDAGVSTCQQGRGGRYTTPLYWADFYRSLPNPAVGTGSYSGYAVYQCVRGDGWGRSDEYLSTDPNCWTGSYYGSRVDWSTTAGWTLAAPYEGSVNAAMYLCDRGTVDQYGGWWSELSVLPYGCNGGTQLMFLGYARAGDQMNLGDLTSVNPNLYNSGNDQTDYERCRANSVCWGECGPQCDGILGQHHTTDGCLAHDECVCRNHGNAWAVACVGEALYAGVTYVAAVVTSIVKTVIEAVVSVVEAVVDFLCFWC